MTLPQRPVLRSREGETKNLSNSPPPQLVHTVLGNQEWVEAELERPSILATRLPPHQVGNNVDL